MPGKYRRNKFWSGAIASGVTAIWLAAGWTLQAAAATYYLDSKGGDDARDGKAPEAAWRSIERANRETFQPGDRILFNSGSKWEGVSFQPHGSGREGSPIVVDRYGEGAKPVIHGHGKVEAVVRLENQS